MVKLWRLLAIVSLLAFIGGADIGSVMVLTLTVFAFIILFALRG